MSRDLFRLLTFVHRPAHSKHKESKMSVCAAAVVRNLLNFGHGYSLPAKISNGHKFVFTTSIAECNLSEPRTLSRSERERETLVCVCVWSIWHGNFYYQIRRPLTEVAAADRSSLVLMNTSVRNLLSALRRYLES